tara:strand:+ start:253 stop:534 length:282 start_codon:yes stop_codon:yes gene_type:complete
VQLYKYLIHHNISQSEFADKIGVSQPTLSRYVNGDTLPSVVIGARIEAATSGEVACGDWENLYKDIQNEINSNRPPPLVSDEVIELVDDGANG